ncbi:LysR family transcriptional regulator [Nonomuraea sp. NPDC050310]|uniref:LysR family transcriptional regulator n=1 Tax=Nonomuraea sp. NPDC050310 TaxID=3154935 RepID=UPI0033D313C7
MEFRQIECFVVLSEELHFARAAERLYLSPGRVSQLLKELELSIGGRLVDRTSRRVALTPLGRGLLAELRPAYDALLAAVEGAKAAARKVDGTLRVGFHGAPTRLAVAGLRTFQERYPECEVELVEVPLSDPYGALRRGEVDVVFTVLPTGESDLEEGAELNREPYQLALPVRHPLAGREVIQAEELAGVSLIGLPPSAPRGWRERSAPPYTPLGVPIPRGAQVSTSQEGLTLVALGRGAMLLCRPSALLHRRPDVRFVLVEGLPASSLGLVWRAGERTARLRAFADTVAEQAAPRLAAVS